MKKIVIIGAGAMGSAFVVPCADNSHEVFLVGSFLEDDLINEINKLGNFHPVLKCQLPKEVKVIKFSEFINEKIKEIDLLVVGVSSKGIDWIGKEISNFYSKKTNILLLTKGLTIIDNQFETLAEKLKKILKNYNIDNPKISAVGGPCLANGLANKINSSVVLANENIEIVKESKNKSLEVFGVETRLEQILANLLDNAVSFSAENKEVLVKVSKSQNNKVIINILDEGEGFKEKDTTKIFKRFYSNRPDKFGQHSGLGLNIVKNLVDLHNATIKASNRVNQKGANMEIIFPKV